MHFFTLKLIDLAQLPAPLPAAVPAQLPAQLLRRVTWSYSTTCMYSVVCISVRVELSPGFVLGSTLITFLSRLFLNSSPRSSSAMTYNRMNTASSEICCTYLWETSEKHEVLERVDNCQETLAVTVHYPCYPCRDLYEGEEGQKMPYVNPKYSTKY